MFQGAIKEPSYRDYGTSRIVSPFVVGDCDNEEKTQHELLTAARILIVQYVLVSIARFQRLEIPGSPFGILPRPN